MSETKNNEGKFLLGFFIGGLIGAIIIVFLGTKEGKKAGKILRDRGQDFLDQLDDKIDSFQQKGIDLVAQGEELKQQVLEEFEEKKETLSVAAAERLDDALAHIEQMQERGRESTASLRSKLFKNLPKKN
jgi:gas vesicle protein